MSFDSLDEPLDEFEQAIFDEAIKNCGVLKFRTTEEILSDNLEMS